MTLQVPQMKLARPVSTLSAMAALAVAGAVALSAAASPIRLLGVSAQGNAVLIESSEPVAYSVSRPDPLTVVVDLRNVSVADAAREVTRRDPVAGVTLEQAVASDGTVVARVRVALARPSEYAVRSARNTIRIELTPASRVEAPVRPVALLLPAAPPSDMPPSPSRAAGADPGQPAPQQDADVPAPAATVLERVRTSQGTAATTVTLSGNGRLTPANVTESVEPRTLVLEFSDVASKAPAQTSVDGPLVNNVRVAATGRQPFLTRVVMDVAVGSTYHVERAGIDGRDLAVIFEPSRAPAMVMVALSPSGAAATAPEPDIPMSQAIANAATLSAASGVSRTRSVPVASGVNRTPSVPVASGVSRTSSEVFGVSRTPASSSGAPPADPISALTSPTAAVALRQQPQTPPSPPAPTPPPAGVPADAQQVNAQQFGGPPDPNQKKYYGAPMTLDFEGGDLRAILRLFSDISGLNIIIDNAVPSTPVNIVLKDLPWDQALEIILRTNQLWYEAEGTVLRIAPLTVLKNEQDQRKAMADAKSLAGALEVRTFSLSYAKAAEMMPLLTTSTLSSRGQIQVDPRTNTLIITDLPDRIQTASALIGTLDRPEPQVEVEARVVQTTRDFARGIGVQWGLNGRVSPGIGNTTNLAFPNNGSIGGRTGFTNQPQDISRPNGLDNTSTAINLPVPAASTAIGLALGAVNGAFNLDLALTALERSGKGRVLSTPRLTTQNNVEAEVAQGVQVPIQTVANNTVSVTFKDAVLTLKVTPQITSANTVIMKITLENATPDFSRQVNGIPPINTQRAQTQVQINDGSTTIIGGIFVSTEQVSKERTPMLHRIPLLGWLFQHDQASDESRELLIFITPRILRG